METSALLRDGGGINIQQSTAKVGTHSFDRDPGTSTWRHRYHHALRDAHYCVLWGHSLCDSDRQDEDCPYLHSLAHISFETSFIGLTGLGKGAVGWNEALFQRTADDSSGRSLQSPCLHWPPLLPRHRKLCSPTKAA